MTLEEVVDLADAFAGPLVSTVIIVWALWAMRYPDRDARWSRRTRGMFFGVLFLVLVASALLRLFTR